MYYITYDEGDGPRVHAIAVNDSELTTGVRECVQIHGGADVSEFVYTAKRKEDARTVKIPPELDHALDEWNKHALACGFPAVVRRQRYVTPYRTFRRNATGRTYLLAAVVKAVVEQPSTHRWITFDWLLRTNRGTLNAEKLIHGRFESFGRPGVGSGRNDHEPFSDASEWHPPADE